MIDQIKNSIGLLYSYYQFRNLIEQTTHFTKSFSSSETGIVILPFNDNDFTASLNFIDLIQRNFNKRSLVYILKKPDERVQNIQNVFYLNDEKISFFNLIKVEKFHKLLHAKFDFAIDLNKEFILPAAYLIRCLHSDVKISFSKKHGDLFYNFQYNSSSATALEVQYINLFKTISMF